MEPDTEIITVIPPENLAPFFITKAEWAKREDLRNALTKALNDPVLRAALSTLLHAMTEKDSGAARITDPNTAIANNSYRAGFLAFGEELKALTVGAPHKTPTKHIASLEVEPE